MELIILLKFASRVERAWMQSETETGVYFITESHLLKCVARKCNLFCQSNVSYYYGRQAEPAIQISRLLLRMRRMYVASIRLDFHEEWTQFDHARLDFPSLVIWSRVFWPSVTWNLRKAQRWNKSVLTFDRCRPHSVTFGYY